MGEGISLYLVRHATAADRGGAWPDDTKRPLTADGMAKFRRAARGAAAIGVEVDRVLSSPLVRARQTADLFAQALPGGPPVVEAAALAPGAGVEAVIDAVAGCRDCSAIALVGHEPDIGRLAGHLIGSPLALDFKKGAVCRIDFEAWPPPSPGRLRWFATPGILERLAA